MVAQLGQYAFLVKLAGNAGARNPYKIAFAFRRLMLAEPDFLKKWDAFRWVQFSRNPRTLVMAKEEMFAAMLQYIESNVVLIDALKGNLALFANRVPGEVRSFSRTIMEKRRTVLLLTAIACPISGFISYAFNNGVFFALTGLLVVAALASLAFGRHVLKRVEIAETFQYKVSVLLSDAGRINIERILEGVLYNATVMSFIAVLSKLVFDIIGGKADPQSFIGELSAVAQGARKRTGKFRLNLLLLASETVKDAAIKAVILFYAKGEYVAAAFDEAVRKILASRLAPPVQAKIVEFLRNVKPGMV